ncbi:hypothetical protein [Rufibacter roseolus]|uniref:hypothetical protein n=1 Tax=Rufibacter roseolus TaxID=2817375 RepID=UPI001B309609|nr:hypothetical protein [Rufibacter roseolus]
MSSFVLGLDCSGEYRHNCSLFATDFNKISRKRQAIPPKTDLFIFTRAPRALFSAPNPSNGNLLSDALLQEGNVPRSPSIETAFPEMGLFSPFS